MTPHDAPAEPRRLAGSRLLRLALLAGLVGCGGESAPQPAAPAVEREAAAVANEAARAPAGDAAASVREWLGKVRQFGADETAQESSEICSQAADAIDAAGPAAVAVLAEALRSDPAWHVREFAAFALARQGRAAVAAVPALLAGLRDENFLVTEACDGTLGSLADTGPEALAAVAAGLDSDAAAIRGAVAELLGAVGGSAAATLPRLEKLAAEDPDASVRAAAAEAVAAIGGAE